MSYQISEKDQLLMVEFHATPTCDAILRATTEVMANSNYAHHDDIWHFGQQRLALRFDELRQIVDYVHHLYPKGASRRKSAIVIARGLAYGIAELWSDYAESLPHQTRVFDNIDDAHRWLRASA